jgi:hypothetical protein
MAWHYPGDSVYHTRRECSDGAKLRGVMRVEGTGDLEQCPVCREFERVDQPDSRSPPAEPQND